MNSDLGGSHLIFAPEDMDSDGSDFIPSDEEDDESINSDNYDMEIDTFPLSRISAKVNIVFDPPKQEFKWNEMSLEKLKQLIQQHRQEGTVRKFLCEIDTESEYYSGEYFDLNRKDIPSTEGLKDGGKVQATRYLFQKRYYTMLGFACTDPDGKRGEAKIKLILQTAKRFQTNMRILLSTFSERRFRRKSRHKEWEEVKWGKPNTTPLHLLIYNEHATDESFRMICNTWPRVVHLRGDEEDTCKTILMALTYSCDETCYGGEDIERLQRISNILFEAAEKTKEGARGLVLASDRINEGVEDYYQCSGDDTNLEEQTVLHIATSYYGRPEDALPIFLSWWPEALKHLSESRENSGDHPFHNIFRLCNTYESLVKSIEAFIQYSSLEAFAAGLLYDNVQDGYVYDSFLQAVESSEVKPRTRYHPLKVEISWQQQDHSSTTSQHTI